MPSDQRAPTPGRVNGWNPETGPGLHEALVQLGSCELTVAGRLPWSSNLTFLVTLDSGATEPLPGVYKPATGEQSLWDFPDGLYRREVAAYALSESLGWGIVPPTVARDDGPYGPGSVQLFVEADYEQHYFPLFESGDHDPVLKRMCTFDIVANNADRKSGHVLQGPDGRLWGIDHGLCFHRQPKLRTVIWDYVDEEVPDEHLADLERLAGDVPDAIGRLITADERRAMVDRIHWLLQTRTYPEPTGDRPPYPWPLV
jgi:uncharacterized repeat protein (TIGR03843 family)